MVSGYSITTGIINHTLVEMKKKYDNYNPPSGIVIIKSGGLWDFTNKRGSITTHPFVSLLEEWRDFVSKNYRDVDLDNRDLEVIFNSFCKRLYWGILRSSGWKFSDRDFWLDRMDKMVEKIEYETDTNNIFRQELKNTGIFHKVKIKVKPRLSFKGLPNAKISLVDEYGLFPVKGKTDIKGVFECKILAGNVGIKIDAPKKPIKKTIEVDKKTELKYHSSII